MATSLNKLAALAALTCACTAVHAEVLPDPTRPAVDLIAPADATGAKDAATDDGLRTIIIPPIAVRRSSTGSKSRLAAKWEMKD